MSTNPEDPMLDTVQSLSLLTLMEIVGPVLLAAGLIYGIWHSRRRQSQQPKSKAGTIYAQDD
jgi:hypothetical protein